MNARTAVPVLTLLAALAGAGPATALEFEVDSTKDKRDADTGDNLCAAADGSCTLRAAISQANATAGDDTVLVPAGSFVLKRQPEPVTGNDEGDLEIEEEMTLEGAGRRKTVIVQTVDDRVLSNRGGTLPFSPVELSGMTITGGRELDPGEIARGGGIHNNGFLLLERMSVRDNLVRGQQGAGGGVYQQDGVLLIGNSSITGNRARASSSSSGGGVLALGGSVSVTASRVNANSARVSGDPNDAKTGGIASPAATIADSTIAGNSSTGGAGGLAVADLDLRTSTVSGNSGREGGGILTTGATVIENSTISGNEATSGGSAIHRPTTLVDTLSLTHVTIARNRASDGHAAFEAATDVDDASLIFRASILANPGPECIAADSDLMSEGHNVFGDQCGPFNDLVANPLLKDLGDYGGPTETHALKASSPAVDLVNTGLLPPTDQRGLPRQFQAGDAGSFERQ